MENENMFIKIIRKIISKFLKPIKTASDTAYYHLILRGLTKLKKIPKKELIMVKVEEIIEKEFRSQLTMLDSLSHQQRIDLATDLWISFTNSRFFRRGWVVDSYWEVRETLNPWSKFQLDARTGF